MTFAVDIYFEKLDSSHNKQGTEVIEHRWKKCIKLNGAMLINKIVLRTFFVSSLLGRVVLGRTTLVYALLRFERNVVRCSSVTKSNLKIQ